MSAPPATRPKAPVPPTEQVSGPPREDVPEPRRERAPVRPREDAPIVPPEEASAALAARRELGEDMEPAVIDAFVDRVEGAVEARVDARLAQRGRGREASEEDKLTLALAIVSLGTAIPLTAIAAGTGGLVAVIVVWIGIVAVNMAFARRRR